MAKILETYQKTVRQEAEDITDRPRSIQTQQDNLKLNTPIDVLNDEVAYMVDVNLALFLWQSESARWTVIHGLLDIAE